MTQRSVEQVVGRLLTDEDFRQRFLESPDRVLDAIREEGLDLTELERSVLCSIDPRDLTSLACLVDPRICRASLRPVTDETEGEGSR